MECCAVGPSTFEGWQRWFFVAKSEPQSRGSTSSHSFSPPFRFAPAAEEGWVFYLLFIYLKIFYFEFS
jgi:hypothetical protein